MLLLGDAKHTLAATGTVQWTRCSVLVSGRLKLRFVNDSGTDDKVHCATGAEEKEKGVERWAYK